MSRDPRRQNTPKADYRPRSVGIASPVRESCVPGPRNVPGPATPERPKGRLPSQVPEKSADRGQYACGPETERLRTGDTYAGPGTVEGNRAEKTSQVRESCVPGQSKLRPWSVKCTGTGDSRRQQGRKNVAGPGKKWGPATVRVRMGLSLEGDGTGPTSRSSACTDPGNRRRGGLRRGPFRGWNRGWRRSPAAWPWWRWPACLRRRRPRPRSAS